MFLTACSNEAEDIASTDGYQPSTNAIAFEVVGEGVENNVTRASGAIYNDAALQTHEIGVFASYTGKLTYENTTVAPDFMWNQRVLYASGDWSYNPVKYWPNTIDDASRVEYLSFFAYAPYEASPADDGTKCIIDLSANNVNGDPWLNYRLAKYPWPKDETGATVTPNQIDLLYGMKYTPAAGATPAKWEPWTNATNWNDAKSSKKIAEGQKLKFTMKHALASFANEITIQTSAEMNALINNYSTITIYGIKIEYKNLTNKARLILNSADGSANWKEIVSGELTTSRTYKNMFDTPLVFDGSSETPQEIVYLNPAAATTPAAESTEGDGLFYIPMQIAGTEKAKAVVTLYYRVTITATSTVLPDMAKDPAEAKATIELPINNMEGKKQGLKLTLGKDYDLMHEVWTLGGTATEPSYSRITK